eukprot:scaffold47260_cov28-Tisochrysis_lutea.AAC.2
MKKVWPFETRAIGKVASTGRSPPGQPPLGRRLKSMPDSPAGVAPKRRSKRKAARSDGSRASKPAASTGCGGSCTSEWLRCAPSAATTNSTRAAVSSLRLANFRGLRTWLSQNWSWFGLLVAIASAIARRHSSSTASAGAVARKKTMPVFSSESTCQRCLSESMYCWTYSRKGFQSG